MKELDFLPQAYRDGARRRVRARRNLLLTTGLLLAMACLHLLNVTRIQSAQAALTALRNGADGWASARERMSELEAQKSRAQRRLRLIRRLEDAAPLDVAIGEIVRLLSDSMALRGLQVISADPDQRAIGPATRDTLAPPNVPPGPRRMQACMTGVAANDVEVGVFLGKLSACPLFSDVRLSFSRDCRAAGRGMREFEVQFALRPVEVEP